MADSGTKMCVDGGKSQDFDDFYKFLTTRQPPSLEFTDGDAVEFLRTLPPSDRIKAALGNLSAGLKEFGSPVVESFLMDYRKEHRFETCLTTNDVHNGLVISNDDYFPFVGTDNLLRFEDEDEDGKQWMFSYLKTSQGYILTDGWSTYVKEKHLGVGDVVFFRRDISRVFIGFTRREAENIVRDVCLLLNNNLKGPGKSILSLQLHGSQSSAPQIVGLWGMAGIGKTTLARQIFTAQAKRYDVCYFLPDFDLMCQTKGLTHLRDEFLSKIFGDDKVFLDSCDTKLSFSRDRFLNKKLLIVLDGVSNVSHAEDLVGGFAWFSAGHTIILTSRNRHVLVQCNVKEIYEIQKLSESESFHFCSQYVTGKICKGEMSLSLTLDITEIANYASGIPLALLVLGSAVQKQCSSNVQEYMRVLHQQPPIEIYDAFRRSFDGLDDNEKMTFLDLACFFKGEDKNHVVNILDGCGILTELGICGLIDESLISLVDNRIQMPNIFKDTGRFVVCQEHEEAGKRSRLWDSNDIVDVLTKTSGTKAIEGIFLDGPGLSFELSSTVFERMYRLRLLKIHSPTSKHHCKVCLPQGLHSLPDELRLLHWERYTLRSLPRYFNPKNLVELNMPYSNMTKLWKGTKNLKNLKRIILSHSRQLTKFPRLTKAPNLEHIDFEGCTSLVKVNSSILHHHKLTFLSLKDCSQLRVMPTTVHLESLEVLNLSGCSELKEFQGFSQNLKELYLAGSAITEVPSSIRTKLVTFDLEPPPRIKDPNAVATLGAKRSASSMDTKDLSSVEDMEQPYKKRQWKRLKKANVINFQQPRVREKSVFTATEFSELGSASSSEGFLDYMKTGDSYANVSNFQHSRDREKSVITATEISELGSSSEGFLNYMKTGESLGNVSYFQHPGDREKSVFSTTEISELGSSSSSEGFLDYMKTGDSVGNVSSFQHPRDRERCVPESSLSPVGLPSRPGKRLCESYFRTGNCMYGGPTCIFDHPTVVLTHKNTSSIASKEHKNKLGMTLTLGVST